MKTVALPISRFLLCLLLLLSTALRAEGGDDGLDRKLSMKNSKGTRYQLLRQVSDQTGYLFVYDSQVINNDEPVRIRKGEYTLRELVYAITGNRRLRMEFLGNHLLLTLPENKPATPRPADSTLAAPAYFTVEGIVYDRYTKEPLTSATVSVKPAGIGTVTNFDGRFRIALADSLRLSTVHISHLGYENTEIQATIVANKFSDFELEPKVITLQEVVVRAVNPVQAVQKMIQTREKNYAIAPEYTTAFYREGVEHKKKNVDLTEAVLRVYKVGYQRVYPDQVKLIKMRRIIDKQEKDTILTRVKSGVQATLLLDLVKNLPEFLQPDEAGCPYVYAHTDISVIDGRLANVISFEQQDGRKEPLYKGQLYIDTENYALLEARFEMDPRFVEKATPMFVEKQSRDYKLTLLKAAYVVSYKPSDEGVYQVNHVRGDLEFRARRKHQWFSSTLKVWFELVNCKVEPGDGQGIPRNERLPQRAIFSETAHSYDANFWGHFNVILPEDKLKELILQNLEETNK